MGDETPSKSKSERDKWQKIFSALVNALQSQQQQLESLADEKKHLQDHWASDVQILESQLARERRKASLAEMGRDLENSKFLLMDSLEKSRSLISSFKLEYAEDDLEDLRSYYDHVSHKLLEYEVSGDKNEKGDQENKSVETEVGCSGQYSLNIEEEVKKLKLAYDNLLLKHKSEVSALLSEKKFVWKQFTDMERECTNLRRSRQIDLDQANEKIHNFLTSIEQLQSLNREKDETVLKLKDDLAKSEGDRENKSQENARLLKELEYLKSLKVAPQTPILNSCTTRARTANMDRQKNSRDRRIVLKHESPFSQASGVSKQSENKGSLKRKGNEIVPVSSTPKLFSSKFKVPKLKSASPLTTID